MNRIKFAILVLFICDISFAQDTINVTQFFQEVSFERANPVINTDQIRAPWIEEYDIRTETRDFDFNLQEYTLRLSPNTAKKRRAQEQLYQQISQQNQLNNEEAYCENRLSLHIDWLHLFLISQQKELLDRQLIVLEDKRTVYQKLMGSFDISFSELTNLEMDVTDILVEQEALSIEEKALLTKHSLEGKALTFDSMLDLNDIEENILLFKVRPIQDSEIQYEQDLIAKELALEEAESKQVFDFAQIKYRGPHDDLVQERVSLGLGFKIPNSSSRKIKVQELLQKKDRLNLEKNEDYNQMLTESNEDRYNILLKIEEYRSLAIIRNEERERLLEIGDQMVKKEGYNPLLLLDIEERNIKNELKQLKIKEDVLFDYLDYLDDSKLMCQEQETVFLSKK